jgi:serine/threonine-protein kinase
MERIGRYQVEAELGRGTMSIVYKAFDPRIDRYLAVKLLREKYARDLSSRQRFLREARAAGGLGHPNIVTVFDVGQIDGVPYLAMELLEGDTLADRLAAAEPPSLSQSLELLIQLGSALTYAHQRGVIHRDIKPANIYFDAASGVAKLLDFGIAGINHRPDKSITEGGSIVGTPAYMAPEQVSGGALDERCDLYALGVLMYRLLGGRLPFDASNLDEQLARVVQEPPPALEPVDPKTPVELIEMTHRLLAKAPQARYQEASEVLEELQDIRSGLDQGLLAGVRRGSLAWRWPLAVGALVALILGLGLNHVYRSQKEAMAAATFGYGEGLASVVAREIAEPLLMEDGAALRMLVSDFASNPQVVYLHVINRDGRVQSSTNRFVQDEPAPELGGAVVRRDETAMRILQDAEGDLEFQVPVLYQARRVGQVYLGLDGSGLSAAARGTLSMMSVVFIVAIAVIVAAMTVMVRRHRRVIERVGWALRRIGQGHYEFRLDADRRDEFRPLFRRFNDMAMRLQQRHGATQSPAREVYSAPVVDEPADPLEAEKTVDLRAERRSDHETEDPKVTRFPTR